MNGSLEGVGKASLGGGAWCHSAITMLRSVIAMSSSLGLDQAFNAANAQRFNVSRIR